MEGAQLLMVTGIMDWEAFWLGFGGLVQSFVLILIPIYFTLSGKLKERRFFEEKREKRQRWPLCNFR